jgi:hypothetical protein
MLRFPEQLLHDRQAPASAEGELSKLVLSRFGKFSPPRDTIATTPYRPPFPITFKEFLILSGITLTAAYFLPGFAEGFVRSFNRRIGQKPSASPEPESRPTGVPMGDCDYIAPHH